MEVSAILEYLDGARAVDSGEGVLLYEKAVAMIIDQHILITPIFQIL